MAAHLLAYDLRHGCLGSIGDHFDGVDEVLALRAQAIEACVCGEIFVRDVPLRGLALSLELIDFFFYPRDLVLQVRFLLRISLDLGGLNLALEIDGTELGNSPVEKTNLLSHLAVE